MGVLNYEIPGSAGGVKTVIQHTVLLVKQLLVRLQKKWLGQYCLPGVTISRASWPARFN